MKLNIGCGDFKLPKEKGWMNVDARSEVEPDLCSRIEDLELAHQSVEEIYLGHVLEHVDDPEELLANCFDWLALNGKLTVTVPDFAYISRCFHEGKKADPTMDYTRLIFGLTDPPEQQHKHAFTEEILTTLLQDAGYMKIKRLHTSPLRVTQLPWQLTLEAAA